MVTYSETVSITSTVGMISPAWDLINLIGGLNKVVNILIEEGLQTVTHIVPSTYDRTQSVSVKADRALLTILLDSSDALTIFNALVPDRTFWLRIDAFGQLWFNKAVVIESMERPEEGGVDYLKYAYLNLVETEGLPYLFFLLKSTITSHTPDTEAITLTSTITSSTP